MAAPPALGPPTPATAGFPRELLLPDERVLLELKPRALPFILLPLASGVAFLIFGLGYFLLLAAGNPGAALATCGLLSIPFAGFLAFAVAVSALRWRGTFYAVTERRLVASSGVLGRTFVDCALDKVQNVSMRQSWFEKLMGYGTISFATSGVASGIQGLQQGPRPWALGMGAPGLFGNITFFGVREPVVLRKRVEEIVEAASTAKKDTEYHRMARAFREEGTVISPAEPVAPTRTVQVQQAPLVIDLRPGAPPKFCEFCGTPVVGTPIYCGRCGALIA